MRGLLSRVMALLASVPGPMGACPNRPGEQVWALCPQSFLKNSLFCRGCSRGGKRVTDTSTALEPAAAASCCQRAPLGRG